MSTQLDSFSDETRSFRRARRRCLRRKGVREVDKVWSSSSPLVFDALFNTLAHTNKFRHATLAYTLMKEHGFSPTVESCNAFMSSLLHLRRADIALAFYREMRRRSCVSPNVYTLFMAIRAYCMLGEVQKGFEMSLQFGLSLFRLSYYEPFLYSNCLAR